MSFGPDEQAEDAAESRAERLRELAQEGCDGYEHDPEYSEGWNS